MTLVQLKNKPLDKTFNNFMDSLFTNMPSIFSDDLITPNFRQFAPVNVKENDGNYILEVVAPGFEKENFKINLDNNILTITAEHKAEQENKSEKLIRKEYKFQSFKRSFTIDENVETSNINTTYINGILTLNLPKKEEVKEQVKEITIQ